MTDSITRQRLEAERKAQAQEQAAKQAQQAQSNKKFAEQFQAQQQSSRQGMMGKDESTGQPKSSSEKASLEQKTEEFRRQLEGKLPGSATEKAPLPPRAQQKLDEKKKESERKDAGNTGETEEQAGGPQLQQQERVEKITQEQAGQDQSHDQENQQGPGSGMVGNAQPAAGPQTVQSNIKSSGASGAGRIPSHLLSTLVDKLYTSDPRKKGIQSVVIQFQHAALKGSLSIKISTSNQPDTLNIEIQSSNQEIVDQFNANKRDLAEELDKNSEKKAKRTMHVIKISKLG